MVIFEVEGVGSVANCVDSGLAGISQVVICVVVVVEGTNPVEPGLTGVSQVVILVMMMEETQSRS